jgi:3-hydroxymyristoyl/3-hydroxydecanoyl-(acyl carrier protein) dehydratase
VVARQLAVPGGPFFTDHFPRRRFSPGTLLLEANLQLVAALARELPAPPGTRGDCRPSPM